MDDRFRWTEGTQVLAVLLRRFANGGPVTVTQAEVEAEKFNTTHPVVFTIHEGGEKLDLHVELPGELFSISGVPGGATKQ
jgi:hypothetical protein